eukprot:jgi/Bigna1/137250/aug1.38_g11958
MRCFDSQELPIQDELKLHLHIRGLDDSHASPKQKAVDAATNQSPALEEVQEWVQNRANCSTVLARSADNKQSASMGHSTSMGHSAFENSTKKKHNKNKNCHRDDPGTAARVFCCVNCSSSHRGGEFQCRSPCKICSSRQHVRFNCPERKKAGGQKAGGHTTSSVPKATSNHDKDLGGFSNHDVENSGTDWGLNASICANCNHTPDHVHSATSSIRKSMSDGGAGWHFVDKSDINVKTRHSIFGAMTSVKSTSGKMHTASGSVNCNQLASTPDLPDIKVCNGIQADVVSVAKLCDDRNECHLHTSKGVCEMDPTSSPHLPGADMVATRDGALHAWNGSQNHHDDAGFHVNAAPKNPLELPHQRMNHCSVRRILKGIQQGNIVHESLSKLSRKQLWSRVANVRPCEACAQAETHRKNRSTAPTPQDQISANLGEVWQADVCFPCKPMSSEKDKGFLLLMDEKSGYAMVDIIRNEAEAGTHVVRKLKSFIPTLPKSSTRATIRILRTDDGEMQSHLTKSSLSEIGVRLERGAPHHKKWDWQGRCSCETS